MREILLDFTDAGRDASDLGPHARAVTTPMGPSMTHRGTHEYHVSAVVQRCVRRDEMSLFLTGKDSPVKADSLIFRLATSSSRASAEFCLQSQESTISGTPLAASSRLVLPSRRTLAFGALD